DEFYISRPINALGKGISTANYFLLSLRRDFFTARWRAASIGSFFVGNAHFKMKIKIMTVTNPPKP
ncbi:MAG: hypothetical protein EB067_06475, partial [Actinobacteria bacterium]|nr:hypothetical protein [Actinomycetota bacterium]